MKFSLWYITLGSFFYLPANAQYVPTYEESSLGLEFPELEAGRTEIELADVNGDGNLDILSIGDHGSPLIGTDEHGIMVWFGDGRGGWSVFQYGDFGYGGVAVGDVNNDGNLDIGYAMHHNYSSDDMGDQLIEVALGDGTGTFWTPWDDGLATNGEDYGMFCTDFADIDADGDLDIGANSFGCCAGVHVYRNNGDGTWTQTFGIVNGNATDDFIFGDVNNDGFPDFAAAHQAGTVYINNGSGLFTLADGNLPPGGNLGRKGPDFGDIDNDGRDEVSFCLSTGAVQVWKWSEGNVWTQFSNGLPTGGFEATQMYDMDADGFVDLAAFGNRTVVVWRNDGTGNWTEIADIPLPSPGYFAAFRIDGDAERNGFADIIVVNEEGSGFNTTNHLRFFRESSQPESLRIVPVAPGPHRFWHVGSVQTVRWMSAVPAGMASLVRLEISLNDSLGPWVVIADSLPNNGNFQWTVGDAYASLQPCRLRYTLMTDSAVVSVLSPEGFAIGPVLTGAGDGSETTADFVLSRNYPNPFNARSNFGFRISDFSRVSLRIYDLLGREVTTLVNEEKAPGAYEVAWDAAGEASGVYFYRLSTATHVLTKTLVLLR
jgi:hypothetical protein